MFKVQYRRPQSHSGNWYTWNAGEFGDICSAMQCILDKVYRTKPLNINDFRIVSIDNVSVYEINNKDKNWVDWQYRFIGDSPWKIGLNDS